MYHPTIFDDNNSSELLAIDGTAKYPDRPIIGIGLQAAVLGGIKGHPFLYDCMNHYKDKHFILNNGMLDNKPIAPDIYAMVAQNYGFKYVDKLQTLR